MILLFALTIFLTKTVQAETVTPSQVVDVMEKTGKHPGYRRNHAKGVCFEATFTASPTAKDLSKSFLFSQKTVPVIGRFSNPGSDPDSNDRALMPRGMALEFTGPKGEIMNMSMINAPVFPVATPNGFHELMQLKTPEDIGAFKKKYPRSAKFFEFVGGHPAPQSYATENYHSLHAFKFTNGAGKSQFVRWNFLADAGEKYFSEAELKTKDKNYLKTEIIERAKSKPTWKLEAVLAENGDSLVDPSEMWPDARKKVELGTLALTSASEDGKCVKVNFDPNRLAAGIEASDDPVLKFRSPAYAISFGKRSGEMSSKAK